MSSEPYPHRYLRETVLTGAGWEYRCRCGLGSPYGGERERDCPAAMREEITRLLAEVRRLTPAGKVARWGDGGVTNYRYTVLRAGNNRTLAKYAYDERHNRPPWLAVIGSDFARFATEPEARARIETWAKAKGWEVRDGG